MSDAVKVEPDGSTFKGDVWSETIDLPSHFTNDDDTEGDPIDWTGSTFTVRTNVADLDPTVTFDGTSTVTLSLTGEQTAELGNYFRWYLAETPVLNDTILYRVIKTDAVRT